MRNFTQPILILLFTHILCSINAQSVTIAQGDWTNPSTWMGGAIPTATDNAIINHAVVINGTAVCNDLEIAAMGSLTCSGSDILTIGNNPLGGKANFKVDGSLTMGDDCQLFLRGSVVFGANAAWTMSRGLFEIDGNNGDVANSVADGTPLMSFAATATNNIGGGTIRFNDPHAVKGNFMIDGAANFGATIEVGKTSPTGDALNTDTDTPFAFGDNISFNDVSVNYVKGSDNMTSFGLSNIIKGNFGMNQGGLLSSMSTKFEGNIDCGGGVVLGDIVCMGLPTTVSGNANFTGATLHSAGPSESGNIRLVNNLRVGNLMLYNSIELDGSTLRVVGDISGPGMIIANNGGELIRTIAAGAGNTVFPIGLSATEYAPVIISNTTATSNWSVKFLSTPNATPSSLKAVQMQWDISPTIKGTRADISVQWDEANEEVGFNRASSALHHWNSTTEEWERITSFASSNKAGTTHSVTRTGVDNFSPFAVFSEPSLPVELISFTGKLQQGNALLSWVTASEKFNDGFDVERSMDGVNFEKIGFVKSTGNMQTTQYYNFLDYNSTQNTYYRLKQMDTDEAFNYSKIITLSIISGGKTKNTIFAYPNPVKEILTIEANVSEPSQLEIVDVVGRVVHKQNVETGNYQIPMTDLVNGVYMVRLTNRNDITIQKIIKN
jgi:hypothetical protein